MLSNHVSYNRFVELEKDVLLALIIFIKQVLLLKNIKGKQCGNKGYIGQALFENLFFNGIQLLATLGGKKVLLCINHHLGCRYYVGTWKDEKFYPENHACMSFADNTFFVPESLLAPDGRRAMWAWLFDARNQEVVRKSGWSGMMSLPRELFMRKDHTLGMRLVSELRSLRYNEKSYAAQNISKVTPLAGATGDVKEIVVEIDPREATKCGVRILENQDGKEYGEIYYDVVGKKLVLDMNEKNISLFGEGGSARFKSMTVWDMIPSNFY